MRHDLSNVQVPGTYLYLSYSETCVDWRPHLCFPVTGPSQLSSSPLICQDGHEGGLRYSNKPIH